MVFGPFDGHRESQERRRFRKHRGSAPVEPVTLKVLVAGGPGVGKTTLIGSVSEISPLRTEEVLTGSGRPFDALAGAADADTTTVAVDFGRITLNDALTLCLFGTPGRDRSWLLWEELAQGALGAVVLADTRRLEDCFGAVGYLERHAVPFAVAVNRFDGADRHPVEAVRAALDLEEAVPVLECDARERASVREVLVSVVEHAMLTGAAGRQNAVT